MNRRLCESRRAWVSSKPQYGHRFHPSGYVLRQAVQRTLFGRGIANRRALYTSTSVSGPREDDRRKTLQTLIELAEGSNPGDCWDDQRAADLLRSQSNPDELRSLGASESTISHVWSAGDLAREKTFAHGSFSVRVEARFESAHFLREYRGISEPLHGHSYKVEAELAGKGGGVDADAIAVDFVSAKKKLEALAKKLDYTCINDVPPFDKINPTAENIAAWFHRELSAAVAGENALVTAVTIWEGPVNSVRFQAG